MENQNSLRLSVGLVVLYSDPHPHDLITVISLLRMAQLQLGTRGTWTHLNTTMAVLPGGQASRKICGERKKKKKKIRIKAVNKFVR